VRGFVLLKTSGFSSLDPDVQAEMMHVALSKINLKTNMIVFDPEAFEEAYEDDERTLRVPYKKAKKKVYAILDDYGSPEALSESLGRDVDTQHTITFLLAEEY